jgi:serine/threonine-protein kinase
VAAGLEAAHALGLVHRDVKPANVLLNDRDDAFVTDFGLAIGGGPGVTQDGDFAGTLDYVAPERIQGNRGDARADVYALGCLLFAALTGRVPYPRDTQAATLFAHISEPIPMCSELVPTLTAFDPVVARAMAKQPDDRYQSAAEFAAALPAVSLVDVPVVPVPQPAPPPPPWGDTLYPGGTVTSYPVPLPVPAGPPRARRGLRWLRLWRTSAPVAEPPPLPALPARRPSTDKLAQARRREAAVRLPMSETFRFVHHPSATHDEGLPLLGNEEVVLALVERILHSDGGAFLLTGFRGVGKTTVVLSALDHLREDLGPDGVVPVFLNVARPKKTEELLFEVIRRLFEALVDGHVLEKLPVDIQRQLVLAYTRTSLSFTQTHGTGSERTRGMSVALPLLEAISPKVELSKKTTDSLALEASFLAYSAADVEHDFLRIVSLFRRRGDAPGRHWDGKVVIVIDELDKLTMTKQGRESLDELVSGLKNLLTTWGVHFVFIAGPDLHDLSLRHSHRGNSVYDSVFGWQLYVPSVWQATERLLESVLPPGWERQVEFASLADYLRFKARGVPRLLLMELNSLVEWEDGRPYVTLRAADRKRIEFYASIERVLAGFTGRAQHGHSFMVAIDEDRWRIGAYYVTDWILRTLGRTFTVEDVIRTDDDVALDPLLVLMPEKVEELLEHLVTHEIVVQVRGLGANERHFGDVPTAQVAVYRIADDVGAKLREFARDNVQERAELIATANGEAAPIAAQPWGSTRAGDLVGKGRYELDEEIDRGGMGRVYRARDRQRGREVAIKMLDVPELVGDEVMYARFTRKAKIAIDLEHPNIVSTLDMFTEEDRRIGIVMAFVQGTSLEQLLKQVRVAPHDAVRLAAGLLSALEYLAGKDIVRLDLKPSSIMITGDFEPMIVDLGLAKHDQHEAKLTATGQLIGTPAYLAPEVVRAAPVDIRADIFTVGMLLFEILAGRPAREPGELHNVLMAAATQQVDVDVLDMASPELRAALARILALDPGSRFPTPGEARLALEATPEGALSAPPAR